jgi:hypothetical protein
MQQPSFMLILAQILFTALVAEDFNTLGYRDEILFQLHSKTQVFCSHEE